MAIKNTIKNILKNNLFVFTLAFLLSFFMIYAGFDYVSLSSKISNEKNILDSQAKTLNKDLENIEQKLVRVDLAKMKIKLFEKNILKKEYDIVSKGKPGSYYETPSGSFYIKNKTKNRYSNMGKVYMPYAMQFYGNFFIHGIPYYPGGKRVTTNYSGGCIRVSDIDMSEIYSFSDIGTKIEIINNDTADYSLTQDYNHSYMSFDNSTISNFSMILFSLENIDQEKYVSIENKKIKIKDLNYYIAQDNAQAKKIIRNYFGVKAYGEKVGERLKSMGIDTKIDPEIKDIKNIEIFMSHIKNNKSHILSYF